MRILFLGNNINQEHVYRNFLETIAEKDSIYFVYDIVDATDFINNNTVQEQQELDLIIVVADTSVKRQHDFRAFINNDPLRTYSKRNFNLIKIPTLLINHENNGEVDVYGFSNLFSDVDVNDFYKYKGQIVSLIKSWRKKVVDEMDNLGIKFNSGSIDYTYYFEKKIHTRKSTEILSESFQLLPRKLDYYWLELNKQQIELAIDRYIKLLKRAHPKSKEQEELMFHAFFNENPHFLARDSFSTTWHEAELPLENNRHYNPDYTLKPNLNYQADLSLIEVKLPNEGFLKKKDFHQSFLAKIFGHLSQINDYKDYLEDPDYREFINKRFGFFPERIDYGLLIGRSAERDDNLEQIQKKWRQFGQDHVTLITYDDLYDYQVKFLDRVNLLNVVH